MARDFDLTKPLTEADVKWLRSRYAANYVDRMVALAGTVAEEPGDGPETASDSSQAPSAPGSESGPETPDEDLIGSDEGELSDFDPGQHTVDEVQAHLKSASADERDRVLALERDGKGRSGILG